MKPIQTDEMYVEKCGKCGALVTFAETTGTFTYGASESYENYRWISYDFCPKCGEKVDRDEDEE